MRQMHGTHGTGVAEAYNPNAIDAPAGHLRTTRNQLGSPANVIGPYSGVAPAPLVHKYPLELSDTLSRGKSGRARADLSRKPQNQGLDDTLNNIPGYTAARAGWANSKGNGSCD